MHGLVSKLQFDQVRRFKQLYSRYQRNRDLVNVGAYVAGSDPLLDRAIAAYPLLEAYLQQDMQQCVSLEDGTNDLAALLAAIG